MALKQRTFELWERLKKQNAASAPSAAAPRAGVRDLPFLRGPHTVIAGRMYIFLSNFVEAHDLGYVSGDVDTLILSTDRYTVRAPDVGFISKKRVPESPGKVIRLSPDLAVKVVSPGETKKEIEKKVLNYFRHGTRIVWVIVPEDKVIDVYCLTKQGRIVWERYDTDRSLDGGEVLPGFRLPVKDVFPKKIDYPTPTR